MLLQPKNRKYRKDQKRYKKFQLKKNLNHLYDENPCRSRAKNTSKSHRLAFGSYGLKSLEKNQFNISASQIEAVRKVIVRRTRRIGQIWIRTFPYKPISEKPTKTRMGKGKGSVQYWVCPVKPGQILFEISGGIPQEIAKEILETSSQKLPILTKFVTYNSASVNVPCLKSSGHAKHLDDKLLFESDKTSI